LGYQCVTQKDLYKEGDIIIYIQPDAVLPIEPWTEGYRVYSPTRIKAVKLRGEWSEGIIVPYELVAHKFLQKDDSSVGLDEEMIGMEVASILDVTKYEAPAPQEAGGQSTILPHGLPKTDEERWENMKHKLPIGEFVDVFLKIDGQSWTAYDKDREFGICGRTMQFIPDYDNNYTRHAKTYDLQAKLATYCEKYNVNIAIRGESYGGAIQAGKHNPHSAMNKDVALFSVYLINERRYARKGDLHYVVNLAAELGLPTVPLLEEEVELTQELIDKYSVGLKKLDGKNFEGVVIQHAKGSFKVINKNYDSLK
jgi:RNA ligase (TIGR02306 family)